VKKKTTLNRLLYRTAGILVVVELLAYSFIFYTTNNEIQSNRDKQMQSITAIIEKAIDASDMYSSDIEKSIGERLYSISLGMADELTNKSLDNMTTGYLKQLSKKWNVTDVSVMERKPDHSDIVVTHSSDPGEIGLSSKNWEDWYTAFNQILDHKTPQVSIGNTIGDRYWVGPIAISAVDYKTYYKYAYYLAVDKNGKEFILNPFVTANEVYNLSKQSGPTQLINKIKSTNSSIQEIGVVNIQPYALGMIDPTIGEIYNVPVIYGSTEKANSQDKEILKNLLQNKKTYTLDTIYKGQAVQKVYIPLIEKKPLEKRALVITLNLNEEMASRNKLLLLLAGTITIALGTLFILVLLMNRRSIREYKKYEDRISHMAYHDTLTGLGNRALFNQLLQQQLEERKEDYKLAVMLIDLDNFKKVNDTLGHDAGDELLKAVSQRICASLFRKGDIAARMGGDEFIVLFPDIRETMDAVYIAQRMIDEIKKPLYVNGVDLIENFKVTMSIGIAIAPFHGTDADTVLKHADAAMYFAKNNGKNGYKLFDFNMNA
jgi:diguanylate cyclase